MTVHTHDSDDDVYPKREADIHSHILITGLPSVRTDGGSLSERFVIDVRLWLEETTSTKKKIADYGLELYTATNKKLMYDFSFEIDLRRDVLPQLESSLKQKYGPGFARFIMCKIFYLLLDYARMHIEDDEGTFV